MKRDMYQAADSKLQVTHKDIADKRYNRKQMDRIVSVRQNDCNSVESCSPKKNESCVSCM